MRDPKAIRVSDVWIGDQDQYMVVVPRDELPPYVEQDAIERIVFSASWEILDAADLAADLLRLHWRRP